MIAHISGRLHYKSPEYIVVDVHGVGYRLLVPLTTFYELPERNEKTTLDVYTHVREDCLELFGFRTLSEKETFLHLIAISGIGPRMALAILSGIQPEELRRVVLQQDRRRLQSIPGVGKKTAERIILELRDRLQLKEEPAEVPEAVGEVFAGPFADAYSALVNLGYRPAEADRALGRVRERHGDSISLEALLKEALKVLA
jgi:Holliday junction DNA helicase RuvA